MKLMIASDIHGSAYFCRKLVEAYKNEQAEKLILLGDILYHGPRNDLPEGYNPKEVIELLNPLADRILCIRGNCDTDVDQMVLDFPILSDQALIFADSVPMLAVHGHKELPKVQNGYVVLCGHTHVPEYAVNDSFVRINPGSVSIPKENSPHSYMIFESKTFYWKNLEGETYETAVI